MIKMTLQQLKYMITVADKGTITDAARELFISQPSLTNQIKALEKEMNRPLYDPKRKKGNTFLCCPCVKIYFSWLCLMLLIAYCPLFSLVDFFVYIFISSYG